MTIVKVYILRCDGCGTTLEARAYYANRSTAAAEQTRSAGRRNGWTRRDRRDLCPRCRKEPKT